MIISQGRPACLFVRSTCTSILQYDIDKVCQKWSMPARLLFIFIFFCCCRIGRMMDARSAHVVNLGSDCRFSCGRRGVRMNFKRALATAHNPRKWTHALFESRKGQRSNAIWAMGRIRMRFDENKSCVQTSLCVGHNAHFWSLVTHWEAFFLPVRGPLLEGCTLISKCDTLGCLLYFHVFILSLVLLQRLKWEGLFRTTT